MRRKQERLEKMKFGIVSDSSCDLVERYTEEEKVSIVPFYVSFDGEHYLKEGKEAKITDFYQKMADNPDCYPKTSMPSVQDYMEVFPPVCRAGTSCAVHLSDADIQRFYAGGSQCKSRVGRGISGSQN